MRTGLFEDKFFFYDVLSFSCSPVFIAPLPSAVQQWLRPSVWLQQSELPEWVFPSQRCLQAAIWSTYYVRRRMSCWYVNFHLLLTLWHTHTHTHAEGHTCCLYPVAHTEHLQRKTQKKLKLNCPAWLTVNSIKFNLKNYSWKYIQMLTVKRSE